MSFIGRGHRSAVALRPRRFRREKENPMVNKPTALTLLVIALFATTAWSLGAIGPDAACTDQADSQTDKAQLGTGGNASDGPTQELRFAYDEIFDEGRLH
jgi:hypothetical protein